MQKRVSLKIYGQVQGVFFRHESKQLARKLRIAGVARNEPDGTVFILAEGEEASLQEFVDWCQKGPRLARVDRVETLWQEPTSEFQDFSISH